jgi:amino acid transporter
MVAALSEEVVNPAADMPIGIVGSLLASTALYVAVAVTVTAMAPVAILGTQVPVVNALMANACCTFEQQRNLLRQVDDNDYSACLTGCTHFIRPWMAAASHVVQVGAICGLCASCFTSLMGQPRILLSLARDGLIPSAFAVIDPVHHIPRNGIIITGLVTALMACFCPMNALANLISLGTLQVFTVVDAAVIILRLRRLVESNSSVVNGSNSSDDVLLTRILLGQIEQQSITVCLVTRTTRWVVVFTLSSLGTAMALSHTVGATRYVLAALLAVMALAAAYRITTARSNWNVTAATPKTAQSQQQPQSEPASTFQCPWVPLVPLGGIMANTFSKSLSCPLRWSFICAHTLY